MSGTGYAVPGSILRALLPRNNTVETRFAAGEARGGNARTEAEALRRGDLWRNRGEED
jgi:hypothetical protein